MKKNITSKSICSLEWIRRKEWPQLQTTTPREISLVDLFCGCGGMTLGVIEAARNFNYSTKIKLAVDTSLDALSVYRENFNVDEKIAPREDILSIFDGELGGKPTDRERNVHTELKKVDVLVAGPPCQGHSDLNNFTRREDPRNKLYLRVIRAAEILTPELVIIENVPTVVHDKAGVVDFSMNYLKDLGYHVSAIVVNVGQIGLPQKRKRHILVGTKKQNIDIANCFSEEFKTATLAEFLSGIEDEYLIKDGIFYTASRMTDINRQRVEYLFKEELYDLPNELRPNCHKNRNHSYKSMYGRLKWGEQAQTITSGFGSMGQGRYVHPLRKRTITPHEAARIQGFPDFYSFDMITKRTSLQEMIANAVPPKVTALIVGHMLENQTK